MPDTYTIVSTRTSSDETRLYRIDRPDEVIDHDAFLDVIDERTDLNANEVYKIWELVSCIIVYRRFGDILMDIDLSGPAYLGNKTSERVPLTLEEIEYILDSDDLTRDIYQFFREYIKHI